MQLFYQGGPLFMGILTILFIVLIALFVKALLKKEENESRNRGGKRLLKSVGTLALVIGILGQLIGLYSAFSMMELSGPVSPNILAGGLKVSLITTMYGLLIFICSHIFSMIIRRK